MTTLDERIALAKGWEEKPSSAGNVTWWHLPKERGGYGHGGNGAWRGSPPHYTTDPALCWGLLVELVEYGLEPQLTRGFHNDMPVILLFDGDDMKQIGHGSTYGIAVCETWLAVKGEGE